MSLLTLHNFRNYKNLDLNFFKEGALLFGENGSGKTNLLESIYFMAIGRSLRGASKREMIHSDSDNSYVESTFKNNDINTIISIGFSRNRKIVIKKNNQKLRLLSEIFNHVNVVSFGPHDIQLIYGDPSQRRNFLDISISQIDLNYLENLILYKKHLLNRNKLLNINGTDDSIEIYEEKMAEYGSYIFKSRLKFFNVISSAFIEYLNIINLKKMIGSIHYKPSFKQLELNIKDCKELFFKELCNTRSKDKVLGYTSIGPHRDDFKCLLNNHPIKYFGSHGQCRAIAITLRLCSLFYFEKAKSEKVIILADDIFNELDRNKIANIYPLLKRRGQLFITALNNNNKLFKDLPCFSIKNNTINTI